MLRPPVLLVLFGLLFVPLGVVAAPQPAPTSPVSEFELARTAYPQADLEYRVTLRAYPDPGRALAQVKTFAFDQPGQQNYLLEKELSRQLTELLTGRGFKVTEENPEVLISMHFFIGRRAQYSPPDVLKSGLTGDSWPVGQTGWASGGGPVLVGPGQGEVPFLRVIRLYFLDYAALKSGQKLPQPPLLWAAEAESEGSSGDLRDVAPVMLIELLGEFPERTKKAMNRRVFRYDYNTLGLTFDPGTLVIREVLPGSPAEQAGLQPGDTIIKVNGVGIPARFGLTSQELQKKLRPYLSGITWLKEKGYQVKLTVKRPGVKGDLPVTAMPVPVTTYLTSNA